MPSVPWIWKSSFQRSAARSLPGSRRRCTTVRARGELRKRKGQVIDLARCAEGIQLTETLFDLLALTLAFNDLKVLVAVRVLDADEHCACPSPSRTLSLRRLLYTLFFNLCQFVGTT